MDEPAPTPALTTGPATSLGRRLAWIAISIVLVAAASAGSWGVFEVLNSIDNSPDNYQQYGRPIALWAFAAGVCVAAIGALGWSVERQLFARALRFAAIAAAIAIVCGGCTVPGGMIAGLILLIAAARLVVAVLSPIASLFRPSVALPPLSLFFVAAFCAFAAAAGAMLSIKHEGLGWAYGID